jgi:hypothetical protein
MHSYTLPGNDHTAFSDQHSCTEEVNSQPLLDWVTKLMAGKPIDDVHCDQCTAGRAMPRSFRRARYSDTEIAEIGEPCNNVHRVTGGRGPGAHSPPPSPR